MGTWVGTCFESKWRVGQRACGVIVARIDDFCGGLRYFFRVLEKYLRYGLDKGPRAFKFDARETVAIACVCVCVCVCACLFRDENMKTSSVDV